MYKELGKLLSIMLLIPLIAWAVKYYDLSGSARDAAIVGLLSSLMIGVFVVFFTLAIRPLFASAFPILGIGFVLVMTQPEIPRIIAALIFVICLLLFTVGLADTASLDAKKVALMTVGGTGILAIAFHILLLGHTLDGLSAGAISVLITYLLGHILDRHGQGKAGC